MEVVKVQSDVSSPNGQKGAQTFQRQAPAQNPPGSQPAPERPLSRTYQAEQGHGTQQAPAPSREPAPPVDDGSQGQQGGQQISPDQWSQRYAQVQRTERELYKRQQKIIQREQEIERREQSVRGYEDTLQLKDKDPKAFVEKHGLNLEKLTDIVLNDGRPTPEQLIDKLQEQIKTLQDEINNDRQTTAEQADQEKVESFQRQIRATIDQHEGDRFELIKAQKAQGLVYDVIKDYFRETKETYGKGEVLSVAEAADFVEKNLLEESQELLKVSKLRRQEDIPEPQPQTNPPQGRQQQRPEPQRSQSRPQNQSTQSNSIVRDPGGINNLSYAKSTVREAARMLRFNH